MSLVNKKCPIHLNLSLDIGSYISGMNNNKKIIIIIKHCYVKLCSKSVDGHASVFDLKYWLKVTQNRQRPKWEQAPWGVESCILMSLFGSRFVLVIRLRHFCSSGLDKSSLAPCSVLYLWFSNLFSDEPRNDLFSDEPPQYYLQATTKCYLIQVLHISRAENLVFYKESIMHR